MSRENIYEVWLRLLYVQLALWAVVVVLLIADVIIP